MIRADKRIVTGFLKRIKIIGERKDRLKTVKDKNRQGYWTKGNPGNNSQMNLDCSSIKKTDNKKIKDKR